jgi:hypothetical protein
LEKSPNAEPKRWKKFATLGNFSNALGKSSQDLAGAV